MSLWSSTYEANENEPVIKQQVFAPPYSWYYTDAEDNQTYDREYACDTDKYADDVVHARGDFETRVSRGHGG